MKPLVLSGIGNNEEQKRSYFIFEKPSNPKAFNEFWIALGLGVFYYDDLGSIKEQSNVVSHFKNEKLDIDVVYTQDQLIIIVRANKKDLKRFKELVLNYSDFKE